MGITSREKEVISLVSKGLSYKEIAKSLSIAEFTVWEHVRSVRDKMEAPNTIYGVATLIRNGIIE